MRALVLVVLLGACTDFGWSLPAKLAPASRDEATMTGADWRVNVAYAARQWNDALGCAPFEVDELAADAHPVLWIAHDDWTHGDDAGRFLDDEHDAGVGRIEIRARESAPTAVLVHELGHALGLQHEDDLDSVMNAHPHVSTPSARDVAHAEGVCP